MSDSTLRLSEVVAALSHALDLTEGQPRGHAVRTCLIGMRIAEEIGLDANSRSALFYALLMKDAGCSSNAARVVALFGTGDHDAKRKMKTVDFPKLTHTGLFAVRTAGSGRGLAARVRSTLTLALAGPGADRELIAIRCERGAEIARMVGLQEEAAAAIRALDEHWNGRGHPDGLRGEEIPLLARIACLAQTIEVFVSERGLEEAYAVALARRGRWFDPRLVDALVSLRTDVSFWGGLDTADVTALEPAEAVVQADESQVDRVAEAFAQVIDAKSPYTFRHSERVAGIAVAIGAELGFGADDLRELRRAALLHDIGKLGILNTILDKPGGLSKEEFEAVQRHPVYSAEILSRVGRFDAIAAIAAAHHERIDGTGYPLGRRLDELTPAMRALAVADVYEAMTADRPYCAALSREEALAIIARDAGTKLCALAVGALERSLGAYAPVRARDGQVVRGAA